MPLFDAREIATDSGYRIGCLLLNSPQKLNALTLDTVLGIRAQLEHWAADAEIVCVFLGGHGRAFCAGGDVRCLRDSAIAGNDYGASFFEHEYRLDYLLHSYPKPIVGWGHGVVMGGGLGLLSGCSHRIVTETATLAMPEARIGLYPDVGASYYLHRLPANLGLYLGLTGATVSGAAAVAVGLADYLCHDNECEIFLQQMAQLKWRPDHRANDVLLRDMCAHIAMDVSHEPSAVALLAQLPEIEAMCSGADLCVIVENIVSDTSLDPWRIKNRESLLQGCPVTAWLVYEQRQRSVGLPLADIFRQEWALSMQCLGHPDFSEGVRAQLVDKDRSPQWSHASVRDVPVALVAEYYSALYCDGVELTNPLRDLE